MFAVNGRVQSSPLARDCKGLGSNNLTNQVKSRAHKRRVIILSCADLCIYRITMCRRGLNWSCDGHGLVDRARARDVDRARARDEVESYFGGPHS